MKDKTRTSFFEHLCQGISNFIGSHWGTSFALLTLVGATMVFLYDAKSYLSNLLENLLTVISFALLFFLQRTQNKDTLSLQIKLNELLASGKDASNDLINIEKKSEEELLALHDHFTEIQENSESNSGA